MTDFFQFASQAEPETLEQGRNAAYVAPGGYFHNNPWFPTMRRAAHICVISSGNRRSMR